VGQLLKKKKKTRFN